MKNTSAKRKGNQIRRLAGLLFAALLLWAGAGTRQVFATSGAADTVGIRVVVIDPGHGGENNGDESTPVFEKYRTMVTALAMYEELSKYEGVQVYLTRTEDVDMSLKERAQFANSVNADMVLSIHYNASLEHEVYGAEIWIPSAIPLNAPMYQFGRLWIDQMGAMGVHLRGIKSRIGQSGDYYGIIRESAAFGIPAVILEHCHLDTDRDLKFADTEEKMRAFGVADATAVAQYYGLKSTALGVDYSATQLVPVNTYELAIYPLNNSTVPEKCDLSIVSKDEDTGEVTFRIDAEDSEEALQYYDYSLDGGATYSGIEMWPGYQLYKTVNTDSVTFSVTLPREVDTEFVARVYNGYDQKTESEKQTIHFAYQDEMRAAALEWEQEHDATEEQQAAAPFAGESDDITLQASESVMLEEVTETEPVPEGGAVLPDGDDQSAVSPVPVRTVLLLISVGLAVTILILGARLFRGNRREKQ